MACINGPASEADRISPSPSSLKEGPVLSLMTKRLRALKKKYNKILQIEESKSQGKSINKEQEDVLKLKLSVAALIDEYEKLRDPLAAAVKEELSEHEKELAEARDREAREAAETGFKEEGAGEDEAKESHGAAEIVGEGVEAGKERGISDAQDQKAALQDSPDASADEGRAMDSSSEAAGNCIRSEVADVLTLLYFSQLFDVRAHGEGSSLIWRKVHERSSCLSYDFVTEDSPSPLLETDLDDLALIGTLLTSRAPNATISHKDALQLCIDHAKRWAQSSDLAIREDLGVTYSHLRERLNRVLSSEYFTMIPELKTVDEQVAVAAVVSGAEQYASEFLIHGPSTGEAVSDVSAFLSSQGQGASQQLHSQSIEYMHQTSTVDVSANVFGSLSINQSETRIGDQIIKIGSHEIVNSGLSSSEDGQQPKIAPATSGTDEEETHESKEQQESNMSNVDAGARGYQGTKGNGRGYNYGANGRGRGYANGRGGRSGGYGNGRSGHYYEQGGYHPRNNYYARGGGRGARGGNSFSGYAPNGQNAGDSTKNIPV